MGCIVPKKLIYGYADDIIRGTLSTVHLYMYIIIWLQSQSI